jgi:hypothetical protein
VDQVAEPPLDLIANHGAADGPRHDEAGTRRRLLCTRRLVDAENDVHDHGSSTGAPTGPDGLGEVHPPPQALRGRQHDQSRALTPGQADRRARPLDRRAERMARPARVRMRSRKPWVFARRRLFGWKVRLLTSGSVFVCCRTLAHKVGARETRAYRCSVSGYGGRSRIRVRVGDSSVNDRRLCLTRRSGAEQLTCGQRLSGCGQRC